MCWLHTELKGRLGNTLDAFVSTLVFQNVTGCNVTVWSSNYHSLLKQIAPEPRVIKSTIQKSLCKPSAFIEDCPNAKLNGDGSKYYMSENASIQACMQFRPPGTDQQTFLRKYRLIAVSLRHNASCYSRCKKGLHIRSGDGFVGSHKHLKIPMDELQAFVPPDIDFIAADLKVTRLWAAKHYQRAYVSYQTAVGDHCSLSKCKSIYAWAFSSFSFTAAAIGNSNYVLSGRAIDGKSHLYI
jgi:hypothetical protein